MKRNYENIVSKILRLIDDAASIMCQENENIEFHGKRYTDFKAIFKAEYDHIADHYMEKPEEPLDRHKVAAIIIVSIIKSNILEGKAAEGYVFLGNYILATDIALLYMLNEINKRLTLKGEKEISQYFFPAAMSCQTDYYMIFFRNLYFAHTDDAWRLNTLDIAERLFLIEFMTLEKNGVDPSILNEY